MLDVDKLGNSKIINLITKSSGMMMGSNLRKRFSDPAKILDGAGIELGQSVLEAGCGTGFFTIRAAQMIGDQGRLIAMDASSGFIEVTSKKVRSAGLKNVEVIRRDVLKTGLDAASIDKALLFGVIPFPLLPLDKLLPEMYRVLKHNGTMAVWLFPPLVHFWVPRSVISSGLFTFVGKRKGVHNFKRR